MDGGDISFLPEARQRERPLQGDPDYRIEFVDNAIAGVPGAREQLLKLLPEKMPSLPRRELLYATVMLAAQRIKSTNPKKTNTSIAKLIAKAGYTIKKGGDLSLVFRGVLSDYDIELIDTEIRSVISWTGWLGWTQIYKLLPR